MASIMRKMGVGIVILTLAVAVFVPTIASAGRNRGDRDDWNNHEYMQRPCVPAQEEDLKVVDQEGGRHVGDNSEGYRNNRRHHGQRKTCAIAEPVTFDPSTCGALGTYTIVAATGVYYTINGEIVAPDTYTAENGTTVTIVAVAQAGYAFETDAVTSWTYTYNTPTDCETTPVETASATTQVTVTPVGGVSAGAGGTSTTNSTTLLGLITSIGAVAFGIVRKFVSQV